MLRDSCRAQLALILLSQQIALLTHSKTPHFVLPRGYLGSHNKSACNLSAPDSLSFSRKPRSAPSQTSLPATSPAKPDSFPGFELSSPTRGSPPCHQTLSCSLEGSRSPGTIHGCRCRRCSLLPLDDCEPKEVSALFRFLRRRKVAIFFQLYSDLILFAAVGSPGHRSIRVS